MDMRKHIINWVNDKTLTGGDYHGVIELVIEDDLWNRFKKQKETQPVICFTDGWKLVPNMGMRKRLVELLGHDTDGWIRHRLRIARRKVDHTDLKTGEVKTTWQKTIDMVDASDEVLRFVKQGVA